jgi:hypothetical protein
MSRRWYGRIALGASVLALAAPAAPAFGQIAFEAGGTPLQAAPDALTIAQVRTQGRETQPSIAPGLAALPNGLTVEDRRAEPHGSGPVATPVVQGSSGGFDWGDAAVGLGIGIGGCALLAAGMAGVHRRRGTLAGA